MPQEASLSGAWLGPWDRTWREAVLGYKPTCRQQGWNTRNFEPFWIRVVATPVAPAFCAHKHLVFCWSNKSAIMISYFCILWLKAQRNAFELISTFHFSRFGVPYFKIWNADGGCRNTAYRTAPYSYISLQLKYSWMTTKINCVCSVQSCLGSREN